MRLNIWQITRLIFKWTSRSIPNPISSAIWNLLRYAMEIQPLYHKWIVARQRNSQNPFFFFFCTVHFCFYGLETKIQRWRFVQRCINTSKFWKLSTRHWNHEIFRIEPLSLIPLAWPGLERERRHRSEALPWPPHVTSQIFSSHPPPPPYTVSAVGPRPSTRLHPTLPTRDTHFYTSWHTFSFTPPQSHTFMQETQFLSCSSLLFLFLCSALGRWAPHCNCLLCSLLSANPHAHSHTR